MRQPSSTARDDRGHCRARPIGGRSLGIVRALAGGAERALCVPAMARVDPAELDVLIDASDAQDSARTS